MYDQLTITTICGGGVGNVNHPITSMRLNNCFLSLHLIYSNGLKCMKFPFNKTELQL